MTVLGAQYYRPPNPPREDWRRDLTRMREAGLSTVKFWACWSWIEGREGEYDFGDLDELVTIAKDLGLTVVINTIIENAPYWLEARAPQARYVDEEGRAIRLSAAMNTPGGGWPGLCFDNDEVWAAAAAFLTALVERFSPAGSVEIWDVWNEPHLEPASYYPERMFCYCDASLARFTEWLRAKYGDLDALNKAWSRRYSDWEQVSPPRVFEAVPDLIDWRLYWIDNLAGWLERRVDTVRAVAGDASVMTHVALSGFTGQLATHSLDEFSLTRSVDVFGTSTFPTWLMADDHVEHLFDLDTARAAARGKPFWQAELQGGRGRRAGPNSTGQPRPEVLALWMWNALAAGAVGVMFWQWRPELLGPESPGYGLTTPDGESTERVVAVTAFAALADDPVLDGRIVVMSEVALLVSRLSALHAYATDRTMDLYRDAVMGAYRMLCDSDIAVTILHEDDLGDGVPEHVQTIYWPMPTVMDDAHIATLTQWVEEGGHLISEAGPGEYTATGHRRPSVPPPGLDAVFGVHEVETDSSSGAVIATEGGRLRTGWQRERLQPTSADTVGTFPDGEPGITTNRHGAGTGTLIASYPSIAYASDRDSGSRRVVQQLLDTAQPAWASWREATPGLITRRAMLRDGRRVVFALNWTSQAANLSIGEGAEIRAITGSVNREEELIVGALSAALIFDS